MLNEQTELDITAVSILYTQRLTDESLPAVGKQTLSCITCTVWCKWCGGQLGQCLKQKLQNFYHNSGVAL